MALAMEWVAKITTIGVGMVLPGIVGHYLDQWLETSFLAIVGFAFGVAAGLWQLIRWTQPPSQSHPDDKR